MFYYLDIENTDGDIQRHIFQPLPDGGVMSFPLTDDNPNTAAYEAWVKDGNKATKWQPDTNAN
jgi:hypothetical protein